MKPHLIKSTPLQKQSGVAKRELTKQSLKSGSLKQFFLSNRAESKFHNQILKFKMSIVRITKHQESVFDFEEKEAAKIPKIPM